MCQHRLQWGRLLGSNHCWLYLDLQLPDWVLPLWTMLVSLDRCNAANKSHLWLYMSALLSAQLCWVVWHTFCDLVSLHSKTTVVIVNNCLLQCCKHNAVHLDIFYNNIILHAMQSREVPDSAGAWYCCLQIGWVWSSLRTHAAVFNMLIVISKHIGMSEQLGLAEKASIITQWCHALYIGAQINVCGAMAAQKCHCLRCR